MSVVSGVISFTRVLDGDVINSHLFVTKPPIQRLKEGTDTPLPDWTITDNQPVIYPRVASQSKGKRIPITTGSEKWLYNGVAIDFTSDTRFKKVTHDDGGVSVPALKIVENLASIDNLDTDVITFEAKTKISGVDYEVRATLEIRLEEMVGEPYDGFIEVTEGGVIDDNTPEVTATAILYKGGAVITEGVTYKWYRVGRDGLKELKPDPATPNKMKFKESDVDSELTIKVEYFFNGVNVFNKSRSLTDETDTYHLRVKIDGPQDLRDKDTCKLTPEVWNRVLDQKVDGYIFEYTELDSMLNLVGKETGSTYTMTTEKLDANNGHLNVIINATK